MSKNIITYDQLCEMYDDDSTGLSRTKIINRMEKDGIHVFNREGYPWTTLDSINHAAGCSGAARDMRAAVDSMFAPGRGHL